jgi:glycerophosphoryl diester phosphodiesterase
MTRLIGHRGARNVWAENSLGGFRNVLNIGVDAVELDVHLSQDNEIMVMHDPLLERTTNGRGPLRNMSAEALAQLTLNDTLDERIPTLAQVLDVFAPSKLELEIEFKLDAQGELYSGVIEKVLGLVEERKMTERVVLTCFIPEVLQQVRSKAPSIRRLASLDRRSCEFFGGVDRAVQRFADLVDVIAVERTFLELSLERFVDMIGANRLGVWVPNTPPELAFWLATPVNQITTDRPDLGVMLRAQRRSSGCL